MKPLPFRGTSPWSQRINPSLPGIRLAFWSRGLGQHSRTASTLDKHPVDDVVYSRSHAFHGGNQTTKKKTKRIRNRTLGFPTLRATVGPLHHRDAAAIYILCDHVPPRQGLWEVSQRATVTKQKKSQKSQNQPIPPNPKPSPAPKTIKTAKSRSRNPKKRTKKAFPHFLANCKFRV